MEKDSGVGSWASSLYNCEKMKVLSKYPGFWFEYKKWPQTHVRTLSSQLEALFGEIMGHLGGGVQL